jgi:hypothetical protein
MNTSSATMGDDDIHAFGRPEPLAPPPQPRRRWPWVLLALALLGLVMLLSLGSMVWHEVQGPHGITGLAGLGDWQVGIDEHGWRADGGIGGVIAAIVAVVVSLLVVAVVVPLVLLGVGLAVGVSLALAALSVVATLGLVLGAAALVLLVATSPLWALVLLLWWALKPRKPAVASATAN